jgi:hypothetical protein
MTGMGETSSCWSVRGGATPVIAETYHCYPMKSLHPLKGVHNRTRNAIWLPNLGGINEERGPGLGELPQVSVPPGDDVGGRGPGLQGGAEPV